MRTFDTLLKLLCGLSEWICGISLVVLTVIFGWLVYGRYVLNATPTWVEQVSLLLIVLIGFLGASVGVYRNSHLGVSYFRELSPAPIRWLFEFLGSIILIGFGAVMCWYGYQLTLFKWGSDIPLLGVPEGLRSLPLVISGALISLYSIGHLLHLFLDTRNPPPSGEDDRGNVDDHDSAASPAREL